MQQDAQILNKQAQLERLFSTYEQKMYALAFAVLHDEGQAEDAVMAAFERIVRTGHVPEDAQSLEAKRLMLRIVKQTSIDQYRKNARERAVCVTAETEQMEAMTRAHATGAAKSIGAEAAAGAFNTAGSTNSTDTTAETNEEFEAIIASLTAPYQAVLRERFGAERSVRETAQKLGISEANVRKRQSRALAHLRQEYEGNL